MIADKKIVKERNNICESCEHIGKFYRCAKCGCFMIIKTRIASAYCPIGLWVKVKEFVTPIKKKYVVKKKLSDLY